MSCGWSQMQKLDELCRCSWQIFRWFCDNCPAYEGYYFLPGSTCRKFLHRSRCGAAVVLRVRITYCWHDVGQCQGQLFPHLPQKQHQHMSREGGSSFAMLSKRACCCCTVYTKSAHRSESGPNRTPEKVKRGQKSVFQRKAAWLSTSWCNLARSGVFAQSLSITIQLFS